VPGQWLCYVFAESMSSQRCLAHADLYTVPGETALAEHLRTASDALSVAFASSDVDLIVEPHISLSRPLPIENAERPRFAQAAKAALRDTPR
jgi:hypothetical protein